ncbi:hypothetical protein GKZ28_13815 [Clostridium chromiireducens]|uniref:Uncharacterized protein n=1 Tax=Clostridium chromiireducens TaxID=225345 RepID=A0A964RN59_9CLOT|nr:hypothetical protein [Clostridium chromiireducens]MVX64771.1 hypothetical protein [Clostridium chromiireducens]
MLTYRNKWYSIVTVANEYGCGFLKLEVVPIFTCSKCKIWTSKDGTTSNEEILHPYS